MLTPVVAEIAAVFHLESPFFIKGDKGWKVRDKGGIREMGADKCAARESLGRLALSPAAAIMSRRESRIPERLKEAGYPAARDVMTAKGKEKSERGI